MAVRREETGIGTVARGHTEMLTYIVFVILKSFLCFADHFSQACLCSSNMRFLTRSLMVLVTCVALVSASKSARAGTWGKVAKPADRSSVASDTTCPSIAPNLQRRAPDTLAADQDLFDVAPAPAGSTSVYAVVEIPAGRAEKWEVTGDGRALAIERREGRRRRIEYLPYPANYGFIPRTHSTSDAGGDGDPLDVVLLGPATACGAVVRARVLGALRLIDDGEKDDKILAVHSTSPIGEVDGIDELRERYPGVLEILKTWFVHYEGPGNRPQGIVGGEEARSIVSDAAH